MYLGQNYNASSVDSIFHYACGLTGKSLSELFPNHEEIADVKNRGDLGLMVEKLFFGLVADSKSEPDFEEAGLELKTTGVIQDSRKQWKAKERLVLTMIDFEGIVQESWETSSLLRKCRLILLLLYLFDRDKSVFDRKFVLNPILLDLESTEFEGLRADWEAIRNKVLQGKAHELSEGDTFVLGACRKGPGGPKEKLRTQPNSDILAKARAFSIKQSFLSITIQANVNGTQAEPPIGLLQDLPKRAYDKYLGMSIAKISQEFALEKAGMNDKGFHRKLAEKMLAAGGFSKKNLTSLGIELKTIRLKRSGLPRQHMSFPRFSFQEIVLQEWESSSFFEKLESKFLFVVFAEGTDSVERLFRVFFWNMPFADRLEAQKVWEETRRRLEQGVDTFPSSTENPVAHVRPKAQNSRDCEMTPHGNLRVKQAFWLNSSYLASVLAPKILSNPLEA